MKKIAISAVIIISFLFANKATAQYRTGIGFVAGNWMGLTFKQYMNTNADQSIELLLIKDNDLYRATGIYGWNKSVRAPGMNISGLNWHFGIGAHVGKYNPTKSEPRDNFEFGVDGQIGIELLFGEIPFSIGLDVNPFISTDYNGTPLNGGVVLRYLIQ